MLLRLCVFIVVLGAGSQAMSAASYDIKAPGRVVAFGYVHGAYDNWIALLQELNAVNDQLDWSGGNTHLVSLGDLIDPGRAPGLWLNC
jgi:hypothetical protein|tara:strand:- start:218 stop:481 length:264 start_codon:yes stop_codon:yes gene_type:complete